MSTQLKTIEHKPIRLAIAIGAVLSSLSVGTTLAAEVTPTVSVGAGVRTSFVNSKTDDLGLESSDFNVNSIRLYVNGGVTDDIKFTFNTEYNGTDIILMDAIARFEFSDTFNIWAGRFLAPSDRSNLYGPYYANHWSVYTDGVQDGYPSVAVGRTNGVAYWGQFGPVKVSVGAFDAGSSFGDNDVIGAARVMVDFWDPEPGYYLNGTYYGDKDIFAIGVAAQTLSGENAFSGDLLIEKKLAGGGVLTFEAEYADYDFSFTGYENYPVFPYSDFYDSSNGYYGLVSYLFPQMTGPGKIQLLAKYGETSYDGVTALDQDYDQETLELNVNYIIKGFNARVSLYYKDTSFSEFGFADTTEVGLGVQLQM